MDDEMARDWLRATHLASVGDDWSANLDDRVLELTQTDLDPPRGWRLVKRLTDLAEGSSELWQVGNRALRHMLRNHEQLIGTELADLVRTSPKYRALLDGQIGFNDFRRRFGLEEKPARGSG